MWERRARSRDGQTGRGGEGNSTGRDMEGRTGGETSREREGENTVPERASEEQKGAEVERGSQRCRIRGNAEEKIERCGVTERRAGTAREAGRDRPKTLLRTHGNREQGSP